MIMFRKDARLYAVGSAVGRLRPPRGFTLIEVVVAMLLTLVMATGVLSALVTARMSVGRTQRRAAAAQAVRRLAETLKAYQTADTTLVPGPGGWPNGWGLPGDSCGCAAFQPGVHALNASVWAPDLATVGGNISYTVAETSTPLGPQPTTSFSVTWKEPNQP